MVEQGNHNPLVGGSNPSAATIFLVVKIIKKVRFFPFLKINSKLSAFGA